MILLELLMKFNTVHERMKCLKDLKERKIIPKELEGHPEAELIIQLTKEDPSERPSSQDILKLESFKRWKKSVQNSP
jgi:hypothetical protein